MCGDDDAPQERRIGGARGGAFPLTVVGRSRRSRRRQGAAARGETLVDGGIVLRCSKKYSVQFLQQTDASRPPASF